MQMRTLLPNKAKHYKNFAESVHRQYKKLRYGLQSCKASIDDELASIRKELVDWEANEDDGALETASINYRTWLAVSYDDVLYSKGGRGYIISEEGKSADMALGYNGVVNTGPNIIEINSGGCITRINLNPAININQNSSFVHNQQVASTVWDVNHGMNLIPNIFTEDISGNDIQGIIDIIDNNRLKIYFNTPVAGKAYLS
jgi:hypothetical protein